MKIATQPRIRFKALASKWKISSLKNIGGRYLRDISHRQDNIILIDSLYLGIMRLKRKSEMYVVHGYAISMNIRPSIHVEVEFSEI